MKNLTFIIKTLDRYYCLKPLIKSIIKYYPDSKILIGDDGKVTCKEKIKKDFKNNKNIKVYELPYDCGLSYGRNYLVSKVKTKYFCLCDDDFLLDRKTNVPAAIEILEDKNLDIIGGYIRNYKIINSTKDKVIKLVQKIIHYELPTNYIGNFEIKKNDLVANYKIKEFPDYCDSDIVLNFFVAKTDVIKSNPWDNNLKLQEHTAFFYKAKLNNLKIGFTNKLSVKHCPVQYEKYKSFRTRNYTHVFMEKNNLNSILSNYDNKPSLLIKRPKINNIFISVIVPVYNAKNKINSLLKSLKDQTYKNFEVIFVDNNSKDDSYEYLKNQIKDDKRFKIYKEKKQGPNYARKKGFEKSSGEYVYFCDSDDYLEDDTLYHFVCEISKNNSDVVIGDYIEHNNLDRKYMSGIYQKDTNNLKNYDDILHVKPALWNKIFKRSLIDNNSFIFTLIGEDMFITVLAMMRAKKITHINKVVYHYILEENGLSSKVSYKNIVNIVDTQTEISRVLKEIKLYDKYKDEINYIFIMHLVYRAFRITLLDENKKEAYEIISSRLKEIDANNKYLKRSKAFSFAYKVVINKFLYKMFCPFIKILFTNKFINKIFKKLDR